MFTPKRTVIITGAGASWHYSYPTGEDLVLQVRERAKLAAEYFSRLSTSPASAGVWDVPNIVRDYAEGHCSNQEVRTTAITKIWSLCSELYTRLKTNDPLVIDYFLGHNPDLAAIGKMLIAWTILHSESSSPNQNRPINQQNLNDNWCRFIVHKLTSGCAKPDDVLENRVAFVTFNYDVSLEQNIYHAISSAQYFANPSIMNQFFQRIPFLHVYGKIRENPVQPRPNIMQNIRERANVGDLQYFEAVRDLIDTVYEASKGIQTIAPDEKKISQEVEAARQLLATADRVYILGFGFDEENSKLLDLKAHLSVSSSFTRKRKLEVLFTNYHDLNIINKRASRLFASGSEHFLPDRPAIFRSNDNVYEKSTRNVYDAFAYDFDLSDET